MTTQTAIDLQIIVPNLDRRPDRWKHCRESLIDHGVPSDNIHRFSALDGLKYLPSCGNHQCLSLIEKAAERYVGYLPLCLQNRLGMFLPEYAWLVTWYACLERISNSDEGEYICLLIDDWVLQDICYSQLLDYITILHKVSARAWRSIFAIQLPHLYHDSNITCRTVRECPTFQFGFSTRDDQGVIYSPQGARWLKNYTSNFARRYPHRKIDPLLMIDDIRLCSAKNGFFGIRDGSRHGFVRHTRHRTIGKTLECPDHPTITDQSVRRYLLSTAEYYPERT